MLAVAVAVAIAGTATLGEMVGEDSSRAADPTTTESATVIVERTARETLAHAHATWDGDTGVITLAETQGSVTHLAVGEPGDVAAVGDWSCDGNETLGVYRPTSGNWFVFDSWEHDSIAVSTVLHRGDRLSVALDGDGCATPIVR
jgi:hypothetical protein